MGAATGKQYKERLQKANNNVYVNGERVDDVTTHPAFKNVIDSMAKLYDIQHEKPEKMLYTSPTTGDKVGMTFLHPTTKEDLFKRREAIQEWALSHNGMMGRAPDYMNAEVMATGTSSDVLGEGAPMYAQDSRKYYEFVRENDLTLTHTLIQPKVNGAKALHEQHDAGVALHLKEKTKDGIIVEGARLVATQGGITDETM